MLAGFNITFIANYRKLPVNRRQPGFSNPVYQSFISIAIGNKVGDAYNLYAKLLGYANFNLDVQRLQLQEFVAKSSS